MILAYDNEKSMLTLVLVHTHNSSIFFKRKKTAFYNMNKLINLGGKQMCISSNNISYSSLLTFSIFLILNYYRKLKKEIIFTYTMRIKINK